MSSRVSVLKIICRALLSTYSCDSRCSAAWLSFVQHRFDNAAVSLDELDLELASLRKHEITAKQKRNLRAGPNRLPRELLGEVFLYTRDIWPPRKDKPSSFERGLVPKYQAGWMSLVHVCSAWRTASRTFLSYERAVLIQ